MLHTTFGVVVLSAALFISPSDAVTLSVCLLGSAVVSRILLMFELHYLSDFEFDDEKVDGVN